MSGVAELLMEKLELEPASTGPQPGIFIYNSGFLTRDRHRHRDRGSAMEDQAGGQEAQKLTLSPPTWVLSKLEPQRQLETYLPHLPKSCQFIPSKCLCEIFHRHCQCPISLFLIPSCLDTAKASCHHQPHYSGRDLSRMPTSL